MTFHRFTPRAALAVLALLTSSAALAATDPPPYRVCQLMSPAVVNPLVAPIADGRTVDPPVNGVGGGSCSYRVPQPRTPGAPEQVRLLVETTHFPSAAEARRALDASRQNAREAQLTNISDVRGLGDAAFVSQQGETVGLSVVRGRLLMAVNVGRWDVTFEARRDVADALARRALALLPIVK